MVTLKKNSRAHNRRMTYLKARRKQRLDHELSPYPYYKNLHQYSKNKIHCSCPLCRAKTRFNGLDIADLRKQEKMDYSEEEYYNPALQDYADLWEDFYLLSIERN